MKSILLGGECMECPRNEVDYIVKGILTYNINL